MSIENTELDEIMDKLENLEDEQLAVVKLREFNDATKVLGELLMNLNKDLDNDQWKKQCDIAKKSVDRIVNEIKSL
ncbi:hypothetical protein A9Q84_09895 [Halobacteriovorax marinus]|uniref:Uncharacterized protein n=1 Tax=Halobacteriovorax marinus TaxID=97084 RepID=A0A1Y5F6X6_9BACT|nr:hypothetical protein A9Q84_09895 [Halobacteriovorax marinus]